ncbi:Nuf2 family [Fragilaria crotonensis]|nr:Nuf2 family [Fragilaria crotonensis]
MDLTSASHPTTQYIFPILRHSDILQCMSELNIELTKAELVEPARHKDRVRNVLMQLLDTCCGITQDDLIQQSPKMKLVLNDVSKFPQLHQDFESVRLFIHVKKCMEICGIYDFGLKDLFLPTAKRFRIQLSAAINMAKFREDQLKLYAELNEPRTEIIMALEEVNDENMQLNEQLAVVQTESNDKGKEMEEIKQECEELEIEITRNNKVQSAKREATDLKKKHNELNNELATIKLALEEKRHEYENLQTKIVSSPERRKKDLTDLQDTLHEVRNEANSLEEEWQQTKTTIVHVSQAIKDVPQTTRLVRQVLEGANKISQAQDEILKLQTERDGIIKETTDLQERIQATEASIHRSEEKIIHMTKQHKIKMEAAKEALAEAKIKLIQVDNEQAEGMARVEAGEAEVKALEEEIDLERQRTEEEISDMMERYRLMERKVLEQNSALMAAIEIS